MQALIDFEGWRKWRGFADPPLPYPLIDHGSPMQAGDGSKGLRVRERSSSPVSPRGSISHHRRKSSGHNRKASNHSKSLRSVASRNLLQESSESTSGGGETSSDSPASIVTTVKIKGGALKNGEPWNNMRWIEMMGMVCFVWWQSFFVRLFWFSSFHFQFSYSFLLPYITTLLLFFFFFFF